MLVVLFQPPKPLMELRLSPKCLACLRTGVPAQGQLSAFSTTLLPKECLYFGVFNSEFHLLTMGNTTRGAFWQRLKSSPSLASNSSLYMKNILMENG